MSLSSKKPFTLNLQVFIDRLSLQSLLRHDELVEIIVGYGFL